MRTVHQASAAIHPPAAYETLETLMSEDAVKSSRENRVLHAEAMAQRQL